MILFLILFQVFADDSSLDIQNEALYKFPAIHFDAKRSMGEWVVMRLTDRVNVVQVSEARLEGQNVLIFKEPRNKVGAEIIIMDGEIANRQAGLMATTDKRKIFCTFKSTTKETAISDSLQTKFKNKKDGSLQSNTPVTVIVSLEANTIKCTLGDVSSDIKLLSNEKFQDIALFTNADTVAAFQAK